MTKMITSEFYCVKCGAKGIPIARKNGQLREPGHLKRLFCLKCGKKTNHAEIKPFGEYTLRHFQAELENGNFDSNGCRITPYRQFIGVLKQKEEF